MGSLGKTATATSLALTGTQKEANKLFVDAWKEMVKISTDFEKEYARLTTTTTQQEIQALNVRVESWRRAAIDELKIEEMKQAELRNIQVRAANEKARLYEELYKETGDERYRNAAIEAMTEVYDAERLNNEKILDNFDAALILREKHYKAYIESLKAMVPTVAQLENVFTSIRTLQLSDITSGQTSGSSSSSSSSDSSYYDTLWNSAQLNLNRLGNAFSRGNVIPFANGGVISRPTFFPMAKGIGLAGEDGEEGLLPLKRMSNNELGVRSTGGGINIASGAIVISGVNKSSSQIVDEIWRPLQDKMRRKAALL
jgi:hypothetical protein